MSNLSSVTPARFRLGDDPRTVTGWHHDRARWNGWACPWVERDQLVVVAALLSSEEQTYSVTPEGLAYTNHSSCGMRPGDVQGGLIEPELVMCADGVERVLFDVSLGCCWEVVSMAEADRSIAKRIGCIVVESVDSGDRYAARLSDDHEPTDVVTLAAEWVERWGFDGSETYVIGITDEEDEDAAKLTSADVEWFSAQHVTPARCPACGDRLVADTINGMCVACHVYEVRREKDEERAR